MKLHYLPWLTLVALPLVVLGCASTDNSSQSAQPTTDEIPEWVLSVPSDNRYAFGVGSSPLRGDPAESRRAATNRARTELIANMRVTVQGETTTWIERVTQDGVGPVTRGFAEEVRSNVPETTLDEIEVAEVESDARGEVLYVMVRLDRPAATMRLERSLADIRSQLDAFRERDIPTQRIAAIQALKPAVELVGRADSVEQQLQLVSTSSLGRQPVANEYSDILSALAEQLDALRLDVDDSQMEPRLASGLREGLTSQGLRVGGDTQADLVISGDLALRTVRRGEDYFAFAEGEVTISEPNGRVLGQFRETVREGSTDAGLAEDRVVGSLADSLGRALGERLFTFL